MRLRRSPSTDAQGLDVAGPTRNREKLLDDLLAGPHRALAIAIAGAGAAVHYSESVYEAGLWRGLLPTLCFLVAVIWIVLSIIRFDLTLQQHVERRRSRWLSRLLYVVLLGTGITAVFFVTELAASNHIARMRLGGQRTGQPHPQVRRMPAPVPAPRGVPAAPGITAGAEFD